MFSMYYSLSQLLAWRLAFDQSIDPADGVEPVGEARSLASFSRDIIIEGKSKKRSKRNSFVGIRVQARCGKCWSGSDMERHKPEWVERNKSFLDGELWAIATALETAKRETRSNPNTPITVFTDSREVLATIQRPSSHASSLYLRGLICQRALELRGNGQLVTLRWIPSM